MTIADLCHWTLRYAELATFNSRTRKRGERNLTIEKAIDSRIRETEEGGTEINA